jgi:hypothetical protein
MQITVHLRIKEVLRGNHLVPLVFTLLGIPLVAANPEDEIE